MNGPERVEDLSTQARNGAWLLSARMTTMVIGLLGLPILMSMLGLLQFGAWAVLLGGTFAFGTLELGMSSAVMRWATIAMLPDQDSPGRHGLDAVMSNSLLCTAGVFGLVAVPVFFGAKPLADWLNLPSTPLLDAHDCILLIYAMVAVIALLRCTMAPLLAARRVLTYGFFTVLQSLVSAGATWTVAWQTRRLDLVLIANAIAIVAVQTLGAFWAWRSLPWRFSLARANRQLAAAMVRFGAALQFSDLSVFVIYQFDKLVISGAVAPTEVAHYEVASRSAQSLGNLSSSPFLAFVPSMTERHGRNEDFSGDVLRLLRLTIFGMGLFLLLPTAVAPIALFAWVGQIGYHAAGTFTLLACAMVTTLLVTPLSIAAQAMGRASMEFKRAGGAMLINVPLSASLIYAYGKEGAALGTLIACAISNLVFANWLLRSLGLAWARVFSTIWPVLMPFVVTSLALATAARAIEPLVIASRWYMAPTALSLYLAGLSLATFWLWRSSALNDDERGFLNSILKRWLGARDASLEKP